MAKIIQKHNECIGCGACAAIDPINWEMVGDKAILRGAELKNGIYEKKSDNVTLSKDAANACPVQCIIIEE
ncbi:MAG: ferredoxin [Candidatus ainarchaeum sp.]|nr:ferredoxin [Candidatus ainarchaeum sp.]